jgi:hypothetical protein
MITITITIMITAMITATHTSKFRLFPVFRDLPHKEEIWSKGAGQRAIARL